MTREKNITGDEHISPGEKTTGGGKNTRTGKITRHTIESREPQPFHFLGVVSAEPDYRLSVMINRNLGCNLRKSDREISITTPSGIHSFSLFTTAPPEFALVSNRSGGNVLLRRLKNIDFLIVPGEGGNRKMTEDLSASLRGIAEITAIFIFDSREISDRNLALLAPDQK